MTSMRNGRCSAQGSQIRVDCMKECGFSDAVCVEEMLARWEVSEVWREAFHRKPPKENPNSFANNENNLHFLNIANNNNKEDENNLDFSIMSDKPLCPVFSDSVEVVRNERITAGNIHAIVAILDLISQTCFMEEKKDFLRTRMQSCVEVLSNEVNDTTLVLSNEVNDTTLDLSDEENKEALQSLHFYAQSSTAKTLGHAIQSPSPLTHSAYPLSFLEPSGMFSLSVTSVHDLFVSNAFNLLTIIETWLSSSDTASIAAPITFTFDYMAMANHILNSSAIPNWQFVPEKNTSWVLLSSLHKLALSLVDNIFSSNLSIYQDFLYLKAQKVNKDSDFTFQFNSSGQAVSGEILINKERQEDLSDASAVSIAFPTFGKILPTESENVSVNGLVMSVVLRGNLTNILLRFEKINKEPNIISVCTAWDEEKKKWTQNGCQTQEETKDYTLCRCNYSEDFLSFSVLMSPKSKSSITLYYISVIGLCISICSLILCLIFEAITWKHVTKHKTAYMRHVAIVNIAVSLLIGNTWFIVSTKVYKANTSTPCIAATYFIHLFYLCVFFWMLVLGLLILYRIVFVLHDMSKCKMLWIAFTLGYGCPLLICALTVAITFTEEGHPYTRSDTCWLNWDESKALLSFVIPVLAIIGVNALIVLVVIIILLRPSIGENRRTHERNSLLQVGRCVAILTPLLGLTWGIGIATMIENSSEVFAYIFTVLNALQGLFILVFGTLTDTTIGGN
ncbi:adhesion G-protein coupled receptor F2 [Bombina bombina]|uniref:adhesion G-protein coupled receptor F2 n=1 Tax=Bombina bombina TaxID=8345 RepID=UPI00235B2088|nr:adhesion G-protein coupled receptor F2 [Bombina bombina]